MVTSPNPGLLSKSFLNSFLILSITLREFPRLSVVTSSFLYALTPGKCFRYCTRCFRISRDPFLSHFVSTSLVAWNSIA